MNFESFKTSILAILGRESFANIDGKECLTDEECKALAKYDFSESFLKDFNAYLANPTAAGSTTAGKEKAAIAAMLGQTSKQLESKIAEFEALQSKMDGATAAHQAALSAKETEINELKAQIAALSDLPETDGPRAKAPATSTAPFNLNDTVQLGGMQGEHFSLSRPYNKRARAAMLAAVGLESTVTSPSHTDYTTLREDLGAFYRTNWRERIQSYLQVGQSITDIFPLESGHQDLETLVNVFLGEFSQADNSEGSDFDKVSKGSYEFGHETLKMYDVMFSMKFRSLKAMEKSWIGYLNREGSNPVKLSFIEFLLAETAKKLMIERENRWVNGVRKDPDTNTPGSANEAADGIYEYLRKRIDGFVDLTTNSGTLGKTVYQILPFQLPEITPGNIGEVIYLGTGMVPAAIRDAGSLVLYIPSHMMPWYIKYNEAKYGQNTDYNGAISYVKEYPSVKIKCIPNADNHKRIFWTIDGNIKTYEHVAGEMLNFTLEQEDWTVKVYSHWKESIQAEAVGFKYTDRADMDGSRQLIWCNDEDIPATYFKEAAPDANPSVLLHTSVVTVANKSQFAITDIEDAKVGTVVSIKCGVDGERGVKIAKEGKFSLITQDWNPKKGDVIKLMKRADGKFIEISRETSADSAYKFPVNATTPSVQGATAFMTGVNTQATAITDLQNAVPGVVYTIHGAGETNASTIANAGKFSLTAAMTLTAGKFIKLVKADDGKFYEVARG